MTADDADARALSEEYRDISELEGRAGGSRYSAALSDGTQIVVHAVPTDVAARMQHPERFLETLERASSVRHDSLGRPVAWGRTSNGVLHCAFARSQPGELPPGSFTATDVASIGAQLARGLGAAHRAGIPHGSIATALIGHATDRSPMLQEFGLFAALCAGGVSVADATADLCDSPYMSPEQEAGRAPDDACDIYALGASLFELLTGKPPFGGRTTSYTMATVLSEKESEDERARENTRVVVNALLRAIEHAPDDRWPNALAFANALEATATNQRAREETGSRRGFFAIFRDAWFPARRSRE